MEDSSATPNWNRPQNVMKTRKMKVKKRALQARFCLESESPKKRSKHVIKRLVQPPPDEEETCEDSTLMDLICRQPGAQVFVPPLSIPPWSFSASSNSLSQSSSPLSALPDMAEPVSGSPEKASSLVSNRNNNYRQHVNHNQQPQIVISEPDKTATSSSNEPKKRRQLVPTPVLTSHSPVSAFAKRSASARAAAAATAAVDSNHAAEHFWSEELCQDWSLKSELRVVSIEPFTWGSSKLKLLEETSGTSAFVRCTDHDPPSQGAGGANPNSYQLDGSQCVGAQFQQCRLYWQFPYLLDVNVFPRNDKRANSFSHSQDGGAHPGHHYDERVLGKLYMDWVEAFRSVFQLIRARQCPYFYMCTNQFTCLFSATGFQGSEDVQVSITPALSGFRQALTNEGIEFSMPFFEAEDSSEKIDCSIETGSKVDNNVEDEDHKAESDDEHTKWLNDLGVSQDVSCSTYTKASGVQINEDRNKAKLVVVSGNKDTLLLFNFLMNSKQLVVAPAGFLAGIPPTILAPVAFVGASLRNLQTKQNKFTDAKGCALYSLELQGPILPHTIHMLSALMLKTVRNFRLHVTTTHGLEHLNFLATREKSPEKLRPNAFHIQSLSDCGLGKTLLGTFCRSDNVGTVARALECANGLFRWK